MIRFVDLRGQDLGYRFTYFDTVRDRFVEACGTSGWDTFAEFADDADEGTDIERFRALTPSWAFRPADPVLDVDVPLTMRTTSRAPKEVFLSIVATLNRALKTDRNAIEAIFDDAHRVPCNHALAEDPTIQVRDEGEGETPRYTLGVLGLLNGLIGVQADGWGYIARVYNDDGMLTHFEVVESDQR